MELLNLAREPLPRWYGLSWNVKAKGLTLSIHEDVLGDCKQSKKEVESLKREFEFGFFCGDFKKGFGFDGAFAFGNEKNGFRNFTARLPKVRKNLDEVCEHCGGSKKEEFLGRECMRCDGSGKEVVYDHKPAFAISATLTVFSWSVYFQKTKTSSRLPQLLTFRTSTRSGLHGAELDGIYGPELCSYLRSQGAGRKLDFVTRAMHGAFKRMIGVRDYRYYDFPAYVAGDEGQLNMGCPGNACGLHVSYRGISRDEKGYEFDSHNVDSPHQQLTLLAGLAALHDEVDRSL